MPALQNISMVAVTLLSGTMWEEKADRLNRRTKTALCRQSDPRDEMTVRDASEDGKETRRKVKCDFTDAANLALFDKHMIPYINEFLDEAERGENRYNSPLFQGIPVCDPRVEKRDGHGYGSDFRNSLSPAPKPKIVLNQVIAVKFGK